MKVPTSTAEEPPGGLEMALGPEGEPAGVPGVPAGIPVGVPGVPAGIPVGVPGVPAGIPVGVPGGVLGVAVELVLTEVWTTTETLEDVSWISLLEEEEVAPADDPTFTTLLWETTLTSEIRPKEMYMWWMISLKV